MATECREIQASIDQRLDAVDQALLGLLSRSERLAVVLDIEARILASVELGVASLPQLPPNAAAAEPTVARANPTGRSTARRRSTMALTSGVAGIVALVVMFLLPITYVIAMALSESLGDELAIGLLATNVLAATVGGVAAVALGLVALVRLGSSRVERRGHGWAITGLCTGPLPALAGGMGVLLVIVPLALQSVATQSPPSTIPNVAGPNVAGTNVAMQAYGVPGGGYYPVPVQQPHAAPYCPSYATGPYPSTASYGPSPACPFASEVMAATSPGTAVSPAIESPPESPSAPEASIAPLAPIVSAPQSVSQLPAVDEPSSR